MTHSESVKNIATALVAVQAEIENPTKNANNPHFKSRYADLPNILEHALPVLNKHGIAVTQMPGFESGVCTLETMLIHTSGEWIKGVSGSPVAKQDPQGVGSAITYLRRYSLAAACGIAQEDDDGNAASSAASGRAKKETPATLAQEAEIAKLATERDVPKEKAGGLSQKMNAGMTKDEADKTITWLRSLPELEKVPA